MMAKTSYKLRAAIKISSSALADHVRLYPGKSMSVEFEGELTRGKAQGKGFWWEWSVKEKGGSEIKSGTLLSSGVPIDSALVRMKTAARERYFSYTGGGNLTYSGWSLK